MGPSSKRVGYLLSGTEGEPRAKANIGYYHRADKLRELAEKAGFEGIVAYTKRNSRDAPLLLRLARCKWLRSKFAGTDAVYGAGSDAAGLAAWAFRKTRTPVVYDVHTPSVGEKWFQFKLNKSPRTLLIYIDACISERLSIRHADTLLWCSLIQREYYKRRGFPEDRMVEVRHGVDLNQFAYTPPNTEGTPLVCYAGTMVEYQGADRLVEAVEQIPRGTVRLKMIGFTERDVELRARAEAAGIETLEQIPHERLIDELRGCDCTVIVAHPDAVTYKNGAAPTKWPESLALGRPILSGDAYDTAQLIRDLRVGWVVDNTAVGLREGLLQVAATTRADLVEMGRRARAEAEKNYGWETIGRKYVAALTNATKR